MIGHDWSAQKITLDIDKAHERQWLINNITEFKGYIEQGLGDTEQHARFVAEYEEKLARLS